MAGTLTISTLSDGTNSTSSTNCIQGSAKAWVNFNGTGTPTIKSSYNVSSVTDNGTGSFTINFTNALPNANYAAVAGVWHRAGVSASGMLSWETPYSTTQLGMYVAEQSGANYDPLSASIAVFC